jgi:hypothetical protein
LRGNASRFGDLFYGGALVGIHLDWLFQRMLSFPITITSYQVRMDLSRGFGCLLAFNSNVPFAHKLECPL